MCLRSVGFQLNFFFYFLKSCNTEVKHCIVKHSPIHSKLFFTCTQENLLTEELKYSVSWRRKTFETVCLFSLLIASK